MIYIILSWILYPFFFISGISRRKGPIQRILVIQTAKIGDMVCSTPVFRALHRRFPRARIVVLADPASCGILEANPMVDAVMPLRAEDMRGLGRKLGVATAIARQRFDISVALLPNMATTIIPLWALIPRRFSVGPDHAGLSFKVASLFNDRVVWHDRGRSIIETYAELLDKGIGIPITPESTRMELPVTPQGMEKSARLLKKSGVEKEDLVVGIAPAARNKMKEVPPALYAEVADSLIEKFNARVVIIGGRRDSDAVSAVLSKMKERERAIDASGTLRLPELPALIARLGLFISVDSGPVYMAIALGVPSINIAGPCSMEERPLGQKNMVIQKDLPCAPCSYTFHTSTTCKTGKRECVTTLTAGPVIEAAEKLISKAREQGKKNVPDPAPGEEQPENSNIAGGR